MNTLESDFVAESTREFVLLTALLYMVTDFNTGNKLR